ncbi:hypothetical protein GCM10011507_34520 [Edaphobacter acidisoli]|uniref:Benenodin family lasso peptide n=1 Tax=Edaphobacter acidisoli TaxID=2040573 RepID=A0A916WA36_9BACT|nr:hypothetical protein [Edaphobacter acidisoli]GGA80375.1 hypothetical protein GCM10011507_34520 [Edaphobacter acidisoli]
MEYTKPEIILAGDAISTIESNLDKNIAPVDSQTGQDLTGAPAYEADE